MNKRLFVVLSLMILFSTFMVLSIVQVNAATAWAPNTAYAVNDIVSYGGNDYKCIQAHTSLVGWEPPNVPALWQLIGPSGSSSPSVSPTATKTPTPTVSTTKTPTATKTPTVSKTPSGITPTATKTPTVSASKTPTTTLTPTVTKTPTPSSVTPTPTSSSTAAPGGELSIVYSTISENSTSYTGKLVISNPNTSYAWNGTYFAIWSIAFDCTSTITSATNPDGAITYSSQNGVITMDLGWQSLFPYGKSVTVNIQATKAGTKVYPQNSRTNYVYGKDIIYPQYQGLPATWYKGKTNLTAADLIANSTQYYSATVSPVTDTFIMYHPPHPTQIMIGQPLNVGYPVNGRDNTRMWIPTPYMAMGLGFSYEWFKINPNYTAALGTKENWAAGVIPYDPGFPGITVQIDGQDWVWGIAIDHSDGPFQQEAPNFNEAVKYLPDYFPPAALHPDYVKVSSDLKNPNWISAAISSAISTTVTREVLNACKDTYYNDFMAQAKDPWAEFVIITFGYNRGIGSLYERKLFTTNRTAAINSTDICTDFNMGGFASHIPTVRAMTDAMNKSTDRIYDAQLTWSDMTVFLSELRTFFANGVPNSSDWTAMLSDAQRAFNVLAQHWGGSTISYRYDFLTLLRVAKQYFPKPYNTRPTSDQWYYSIKGATP